MKRHEIHLGFMQAAMTGSYTIAVNPQVQERMRKDMKSRKEDGETYHARFALEAADAALAAFERRWPDVKLEE